MDEPSDIVLRQYLHRARSGRERHETLPRLARMCDDILSGEAYRLAKETGSGPASLEARRITPAAIGAYLRLRVWDGPHPLTVANRYAPYVRARTKEALREMADD